MLYQQIASNKRKTLVVIALYMALFIAVGIGIGYYALRSVVAGVIIALVAGGLYSMMMIANATNVVMQLNHAREITDKNQAPMIWNIVTDMAMIAKVPMPRIFIIEDESPNAFATGSSPENAAVAVTTGLLERLNREELEGVIAHEFGHIRNYDVRLQTIAIALGAVIAMLVQFGSRMMFWGGGSRDRDDDNEGGGANAIFMVIGLIAMILGPFMSTILQLALSRNREYLADASAVEFTRNPYGLISALTKISEAPPMTEADQKSAALYISNPFGEEGDSLFSTHPSTANRIKRLEKM